MEYSSFLVTQGAREAEAKEESVLDISDSTDENQRLLDTLSRSHGQAQKGVLSFRSTPQVTGSRESISHNVYMCAILTYGAPIDSYMEDYRDSSAVSSRTRHTVKLISPQKALDAPTIMDDYCKSLIIVL